VDANSGVDAKVDDRWMLILEVDANVDDRWMLNLWVDAKWMLGGC
jgi:hypothetical protein